jgi:hypothetical protein
VLLVRSPIVGFVPSNHALKSEFLQSENQSWSILLGQGHQWHPKNGYVMKISGRHWLEVAGFPLELLYPGQTNQVFRFREYCLKNIERTSAKNAGKSDKGVEEAGVACGFTLESSTFCPRCTWSK